MSDALTPLIAAYRAERRGTSLDTAALRDRILDAAARRRHRRSRRVTWLIPVAAVLAGSGALAASAPTRAGVTHFLERLAVAVSLAPAERLAPAPSHPAARRSPPNPPKKAAPAPLPRTDALPSPPAPLPPAPALTLDPVPEIPRPEAALAPPAPRRAPAELAARAPAEPMVTDAPDAQPAAEPRHAASSRAPTDARARSQSITPADPALERDLGAYRVAHRFHFELADYARALKAWDGYLARFPRGTFAPEARVNRAVALARVGEQEQARRSLSSIARGSYGEDGRAQAQQLLESFEPAER